jgi:hypothetical protein
VLYGPLDLVSQADSRRQVQLLGDRKPLSLDNVAQPVLTELSR